MSVKFDYDEYLKLHPDVRVWMTGYKVQKIAPFEPLIRDSFAIQAAGEMSRFFGKDKS